MTRKFDRTRRLAVLVPALLLVLSSVALAQKTAGTVRGTVYDNSGAIVTAATIKIQNQDTGFTMDRSVDSRGEFAFPLLDPGSYRVEVTAAGFKKYIKQDIVLRALETVAVTVNLELGPVEETLVVTAEPDQVNISTGGVTQRLARELVSEFPSLNRYGFANAALMPAIRQVEERRETINASVAGNTANRNAFYIDGAEATDPWRGWSPRQPIADAFDEIVVSTAGASPDVGANFGGTYNAIFKSGTNTLHGGAWYYFRDKGLNANSWVNNRAGLDRPNDPLKYYGAQIGGPIIKDKAFIYVTAGRETDEQPYTLSGMYAPTSAMVQGDFSAVPYTIHNPDTGEPFPGNVIPQNMLDPTALAFWDKYGYTIPSYGPTWGFGFSNERKVWNLNGRMDFNLNANHRLTLSGYYFQNKTTSPDARVQSISGSPTGGTTGNTFGPDSNWNELSNFPQTVISAKHTWMVQPNIFAEIHGSWSSMPEQVVMDDASLGTTLGTLGANDPLPRPGAPELLPTMVIGQWWGSPEGAILFHGWTTDFTVKNLSLGTSTTWITGSHNVKVGAEFQSGQYHSVQVARGNDNGISFNGNATSNNNVWQGNGAPFAYGFADFMLGRFDNYTVNDESESTLQSWNLGVYVMDQLRVGSRMTITPGLRLEINSGISEKNNQLTMYRPGLQSTLFPNAPPGVVTAGDAGLPDSFVGVTTKLAPRFNAAYDLTGDGKTAIRGSAGLYYGRDVMALYQTAFLSRPPYSGTSAVARNGRLSDPWLTSQSPTYSSLPLPFTDQDPANYSWPSQITGLYQLDPDYSLPSSWQWNVALEREIIKGIRLELGYQGNSCTTGPTNVQTNLAAWAPDANDSSSNINARRPNQFLGDNAPRTENSGRSRFDQILLTARVRRSSLFGEVRWTFTHARRNFNGTDAVQNNRDWDQGITSATYPDLMFDFQNNHNISGFLIWNLPLLKNNKDVLGKILGGWSLTADGYINMLNKGATVYTGTDTNADGYGADIADVTGAISYPKIEITGQDDLLYQWFDTSAFGYPGGVGSGVFTSTTTSSGANALNTLPGSWMLNSALLKSFNLTEVVKLQARFEVYNVLNHANLNGPNSSVSSGDFGKIRGKYGEGRRIQLGARLQF
ncbi:MAG: carboxypeptidase regulatory-like domain-containing protein [Vicinamibacteria bacterium]|nr:carboxypeptidase regulatory-like domain-containing protein [Vicinamibacteria bacterium]